MQEARLDVVTIGNAIVDVIAHAEDTFLIKEDIVKGSMTLIEEPRADHLYAAMGQAIQASGGSAANTAAGIASFGGKTGYIGLIKDDPLGQFYIHDMTALGIDFTVKPAAEGPGTGRSMILVTPDAERSMNTYLGAAALLEESTLDLAQIKDAAITYMEGYLFDRDPAKKAYYLAAQTAHEADRRVSLSLSDSFCVARHRADFRDLVRDNIDILFANEDEIMALYEVDNFDAALQAVRADCDMACLTRGDKGSVIAHGDEVHVIDANAVERVVDTTGAGDQYAAGVLFGLTNGFSVYDAGRLGGLAAEEVIAHMGPRPEIKLSQLAESLSA